MKNSIDTAARWTKFIAERPEFICGNALISQFGAGKITRLCECGCNSFNIELTRNVNTTPMVSPTNGGRAVFFIEFATAEPMGSLELIVFADAQGNWDGIDVHFNGNTEPMPDNFVVVEPPYHVHGVLARER
jgi:hypothetical protein